MSPRKKILSGMATIGLVPSIPVSAMAVSASVPGAYAFSYTFDGLWAVELQDTAADNRRADAEFRRGSVNAPGEVISATGGYGDVVHSVPSTSTIEMLRVCTRNDNPLQPENCSAWDYR